MNIAMQDLDIRGAGNLLGAEQSGFIADLGYETYQKILAEAVKELKNEEFADILHDEEADKEYVSECTIESDLELLFPPLYVPNGDERVLLYRELDSITNDKDLKIFHSKMTDRFGRMPKAGEELIRTVSLRRKAKELGIEKIYLKGGRMNLFLVDGNSPYYESELFGKIIAHLPTSQFTNRMRESDGRCIITVEHVNNVETAAAFIDELQAL
jgi:transcription-repair coupling factor (superfamily II helicase)